MYSAAVMNKAELQSLASQFAEQFDAKASDAVWLNHQKTFQQFWNTRVRTADGRLIPDSECDEIIRFLDRNGRGNTRQSEAVAKAMVPQGVWRKLINRLKSPDLGDIVDSIFHSKSEDERGNKIDELYAKNTEKNYLTGPSGNTINALLAAYDPFTNLSIISVGDRESLLRFLGCELPPGLSLGMKIAKSTEIIRKELASLGMSGTARTISRFCYWEPMQVLWKKGDTAKRPGKTVKVIVPTGQSEDGHEKTDETEVRESMQIQAALAELGAGMGFKIWIPIPDRGRVLKAWTPVAGALLDELPFNYEMTTLKTIEAIDVIWVRNRSIVRAFEVEHTTSVYSGILRMADLLALQPNMSIKLHLVAPESKREKVFREIQRPVFSLLEGNPLSEVCTYLSYDSVKEMQSLPHASHLTDSVIEDFEESAPESE